jgi:hypothetical protein
MNWFFSFNARRICLNIILDYPYFREFEPTGDKLKTAEKKNRYGTAHTLINLDSPRKTLNLSIIKLFDLRSVCIKYVVECGTAKELKPLLEKDINEH